MGYHCRVHGHRHRIDLYALAAGILYVSDYLLWAGIRMNQWMSGWPKASIGIGGLNAAEIGRYYITVCLSLFQGENPLHLKYGEVFLC